MSTARYPLKKAKRPSACDRRGKRLVTILHDHVFVPSGRTKVYWCVQTGRCDSKGVHQCCERCGWPEDEHPPGPGA